MNRMRNDGNSKGESPFPMNAQAALADASDEPLRRLVLNAGSKKKAKEKKEKEKRGWFSGGGAHSHETAAAASAPATGAPAAAAGTKAAA